MNSPAGISYRQSIKYQGGTNTGMLFETDKTFLLPRSLRSIKAFKRIYDKRAPGAVLVVGHTDTAGSQGYNVGLSVDRAGSIRAYLTDDANDPETNPARPGVKDGGIEMLYDAGFDLDGIKLIVDLDHSSVVLTHLLERRDWPLRRTKQKGAPPPEKKTTAEVSLLSSAQVRLA